MSTTTFKKMSKTNSQNLILTFLGFLFVFLLFYFSTLISSAWAQSGAISPSLSVSPPLVRQNVIPGKSSEIKITLTNLGTDPIPLGASKMNIARISDQGAPEFTTQFGPRSANDWLEVLTPDLILEAASQREVTVRISPPIAIAPGGYNAVLVFQAKLPSYYFDLDANTRILPALAISFLLSVNPENVNAAEQLQIKRLETPKVVLGGPVPLVTEINNPSNFFVFADGDLTLNPTFGADKKVTELVRSVLMPESSRKYISAYSGPILPGIYNAKLGLRQGDKTLVASARFIAIPWQFLLIALVVGGAGLALRVRRRMKRAWAALSNKGSDPARQPRRPTIR